MRISLLSECYCNDSVQCPSLGRVGRVFLTVIYLAPDRRALECPFWHSCRGSWRGSGRGGWGVGGTIKKF